MKARLSVPEVVGRLEGVYGELPPRPRRDPLSELILTILSQNTSDVNSGRAFRNLREAWEGWEGVARADAADIARAIRPGGLAQVKAPRIKAILGRILEERGDLALSFLGEMPLAEARRWLTALPGVGPKTAACVLLFSLGRPALPVDTHVHRVARRLGLIGDKVSAEKAQELLEALVPPEAIYPFHLYLIWHGRRVCTARRPRCPECVLLSGCPAGQGMVSNE